ncbi:MAG: hypothetical protein QOD72_2291 [Acidimicrobiaceae bacterium]|nr:hypothetical protein [Acidimicrobiaceae bacterium]
MTWELPGELSEEEAALAGVLDAMARGPLAASGAKAEEDGVLPIEVAELLSDQGPLDAGGDVSGEGTMIALLVIERIARVSAAVSYAATRHQFGRRLDEFAALRARLAAIEARTVGRRAPLAGGPGASCPLRSGVHAGRPGRVGGCRRGPGGQPPRGAGATGLRLCARAARRADDPRRDQRRGPHARHRVPDVRARRGAPRAQSRGGSSMLINGWCHARSRAKATEGRTWSGRAE